MPSGAMKLIMSHPTGNANVRAAAAAFAREKILLHYYTSFASFPGTLLDDIGGLGPFSEIRRRRYDDVLKPYTKMFPFFETGRLLSAKLRLNSLTAHEKGIFSVDSVYRHLDRTVSEMMGQTANVGVYAYEDGAYETFKKAKDFKIPCFYDLPIGYWRTAKRLLEKEREVWPDWAATLTGLSDSPEKLEKKDQELELADTIFAASRFTAESLKDYRGTLAPVRVIPYGFPSVVNERKYRNYAQSAPLKILFVGGLSQRKGIANLFKVTSELKDHVSLTVVGRKAAIHCPVLDEQLAKVNWIESLPHAKILELMLAHDVLIFPSLFEGFGLVITEAMSQGTPVITTERTAGPDLIEDGHNGWLTEAGSTESLRNAIERLLREPRLIEQAGRAAMETARQRPWSQYGAELAEAVTKSFIIS
jgi:glycosyltransferase involved in cell wall biosynthesis